MVGIATPAVGTAPCGGGVGTGRDPRDATVSHDMVLLSEVWAVGGEAEVGGAGGAGAGGAGVVDRAAGDNEAVRCNLLRALRRRVFRSVVMGVYAKRETPPTGWRGGNEGLYNLIVSKSYYSQRYGRKRQDNEDTKYVIGWDLIQVALSPGSKTSFRFLVIFLPGFPDPKNQI